MTRTRIARPVSDLCKAPNGARERQLLMGDHAEVLSRQDGWCHLRAEKDGYTGWVAETHLAEPLPMTHWVSAPATHAYAQADFKSPELTALSLGSQVAVRGTHDRFAQTDQGFVPLVHLSPLATRAPDPVTVAEALLGTPYLWGAIAALALIAPDWCSFRAMPAVLNAPATAARRRPLWAALCPTAARMSAVTCCSGKGMWAGCATR